MICSPNEKNIAGQRFGKLTAIKRDFSKENKRLCWFFQCDCGNVKSIGKNNVVNSNTTSCGCYVIESNKQKMTIHGLVYHELYETWSTMKKRCYKEYNKDYPRYGGRGIRVCKRWLDSFANFLEDMGERPQGCTLDRINNNGYYEPSNCRWANSIQQNSNRSGLRQVEINGIVYNTVAEASRATGLSRRQIYYRYINFK